MKLDVATAQRPHPLEQLCGDAAVAREGETGVACAIIDGVGHGPPAHGVAMDLAACFLAADWSEPEPCLRFLHERARGTVGAAVGIVCLDTGTGALRYAGVGNTTARLVGSSVRHFVSHDGVLGLRMRSTLRQVASVEPGDVVLLHTDGITGELDPAQLPGLCARGAVEAARAIVARFGRPHDDAACVVIRVISDAADAT